MTLAAQIYKLVEKDISGKLELLIKKDLYTLAIKVASNQRCDDATISDIYKRFGDHLYT